MNLRTVIASAAFLVAIPAVASAQPGYGPPPRYQPAYQPPAPLEGGFHDRAGRLTLGLSLGLGGMSSADGSIDCASCDYNPITVGVAGHIGGMINHRLALMLELQANGQVIDENIYGDTATLVQGAAMGAAQYWITPQLWIKGGIGFAHLSVSYDGYYGEDFGSEDVADGIAVLGAAGYELLSARTFSVDLQGRLFVGSYDELDDQITSGTIGVGINWF
jgi:hypothetical protein